LLAAVAAFGWHLALWGDVVEHVHKVPAIRAVSPGIPVTVSVNPFTDRVTLTLAAPDSKDLLSKLGSALAGALVEDVWPSAVEKELAEFAAAHNDWYARLVPFRAVVARERAAD
jgi:hypothetical protein